MRSKVLKKGREIQSHLIESETGIDRALIGQTRLLAAMLEARIELGFAAHAEHEVIAQIGRGVTDNLANRERTREVHNKLADLARRWGFQPTSFGEAGDKDANALKPHLEVVQAAA